MSNSPSCYATATNGRWIASSPGSQTRVVRCCSAARPQRRQPDRPNQRRAELVDRVWGRVDLRGRGDHDPQSPSSGEVTRGWRAAGWGPLGLEVDPVALLVGGAEEVTQRVGALEDQVGV